MSKSSFPNKIALVGHAYSGKSSTAKEISSRHGHKIVSLAEPIKEAEWMFDFLKLSASNKAEKRKLYQALGSWARKQNEKFFIELLEKKYREPIYKDSEKVIVDDCRFLNEAIFFTLNDFTLVYVECPKETLYKRAFGNGENPEELYDYESEREIDDIGKMLCPFKVSGVEDVKLAVSRLEEEIAFRTRGMYI